MTSVHQKMTLSGVHTLLSASCREDAEVKATGWSKAQPTNILGLDLGFELPEL